MGLNPVPCPEPGECDRTTVTLCDDDGPFLRLIDPCSVPPTIVGDFTLNGAPYEPVGTVTTCSGGGGGDCSTVLNVRLCDDTGPFLRLFRISCAGVVTASVDVELDGVTPHDTTGDVGTCPVEIAGPDGTIAAVYARTDAVPSLAVADDCQHMQAKTLTLVSGDDTPVIFDQPGRILRVKNWSQLARLCVKDGAITDAADPDATRVGVAPTTSVPGATTFPFLTDTIHLLSSVAAEVSVELFW